MTQTSDTPERRLKRLLQEKRALSERLRQGAISREEYQIAFRKLVCEARLDEPNLSRPWWADDLAWTLRAIIQAAYSGVLRDREHLAIRRRTPSGLRPADDLDDCHCLAVDLPSALPVLARYGFDLPIADAHTTLLLAQAQHPDLVVTTRVKVSFGKTRRWAVVLDWVRAKELAASPRRKPSTKSK